MMSLPKQVIVLRKDLKMRRGKEIAQGAHGSMKAILDQMDIQVEDGKLKMSCEWDVSDPVALWLMNKFTKIAVYAQTEEELLALYEKAQEEGLPSSLITDSGLTEFHGVPTNTCIAIGPADRAKIDSITGHLPLA